MKCGPRDNKPGTIRLADLMITKTNNDASKSIRRTNVDKLEK